MKSIHQPPSTPQPSNKPLQNIFAESLKLESESGKWESESVNVDNEINPPATLNTSTIKQAVAKHICWKFKRELNQSYPSILRQRFLKNICWKWKIRKWNIGEWK